MDIIRKIENMLIEKKEHAKFSVGDTVAVTYKIKEGDKERSQIFQGLVIQRSSNGVRETFTVRKMSGSVGVERIFPICSPFLEDVKVIKHGKVRRAKLFYVRDFKGAIKIKEKKFFKHKTPATNA
jgi:large subunit ribosomal protein L19